MLFHSIPSLLRDCIRTACGIRVKLIIRKMQIKRILLFFPLFLKALPEDLLKRPNMIPNHGGYSVIFTHAQPSPCLLGTGHWGHKHEQIQVCSPRSAQSGGGGRKRCPPRCQGTRLSATENVWHSRTRTPGLTCLARTILEPQGTACAAWRCPSGAHRGCL